MEAKDTRARSVQRILLAEDDEDMRRFLVKALEKAGYDVIAFGNVAIVVEILPTQSEDATAVSRGALRKNLDRRVGE